MLPFGSIRQGLGIDVSDHISGLAVGQLIVKHLHSLAEPCDTDTMRSSEMSHRRIATGLAYAYHGLNVLKEPQCHRLVTNGLEEIQNRHPLGEKPKAAATISASGVLWLTAVCVFEIPNIGKLALLPAISR